jgi:hypothetical protein
VVKATEPIEYLDVETMGFEGRRLPLIPPPMIARSKSAMVLVLAAGTHPSRQQVTVQADVVE